MLLAFGMVAAILGARATGKGQVVDAAMVDGAASLMTMTYTLRSAGIWQEERGTNLLDTGAHFYEVYETRRRGVHSPSGAIEPQFYAELMQLLGLGDEDLSTQMDRTDVAGHEGALRRHLRHQDPGRVGDASSPAPTPAPPRCCRPAEAPDHPHNVERATFTEVAGVVQPAPSPRFLVDARRDPAPAAPPRPARLTRRWPTGGCPTTGGRVALESAPSADGGGPAGRRPGRSGGYRLTTGQVTVRMMPSISWIRPTTIWPELVDRGRPRPGRSRRRGRSRPRPSPRRRPAGRRGPRWRPVRPRSG